MFIFMVTSYQNMVGSCSCANRETVTGDIFKGHNELR